jgi:hypothetical protein
MDSVKYVILNEAENKVANIILAESVTHAQELTDAKAVEVDGDLNVSIGDDYDGEVFSNAARAAHEIALAEAIAEGEAAEALEAAN